MKKIIPTFEQFISNLNVSEAFNVKKAVKDLQKDGYDAEVFGKGVLVNGVESPNPDYDGTVSMTWDEKDGIYAEDDRFNGDDHSYDSFLDILGDPTYYEGQWG